MSGKKGKAYRVKITETRAMTVEVEAENELIAEQRVNDSWRNSEYILDAAHFAGVTFEVVGNEKSAAEPGDSLKQLLLRKLNELMELEVAETIGYSTTETCSAPKNGYEVQYERQRAKIGLIQSAKDDILFSFGGDGRIVTYDNCRGGQEDL